MKVRITTLLVKERIMKKIFMFLFCVCAIGTAFGAENCNYVKDLKSRKNLNIGSMEALEIKENEGFVCDANIGGDDTCPYGSVILKLKEAGSDVTPVHESGIYKCNDENGAEDHWRQNVGLSDCTEIEYQSMSDREFVGNKYLIRKAVWEEISGAYKYKVVFDHYKSKDLDMASDYICKANVEIIKCINSGLSWVNGRCVEEGDCSKAGYNKNCSVLGTTGSICAKTGAVKNNNTCTPVVNKYPLTNMNHKKSGNNCRVECKADGWDTTLMSNACEQGYKPNTSKKQCVQKEPQKPNDGNDGGGNNGDDSNGGNNGNNGGVVADDGTSVTPSYECPEITNGYAYWRAQYKDCSDVIAALDELETYCKSNPKVDGYTTRVAGLESLRDQCKKSQRITKSTATITDASKTLDEIISRLKVDVWKNAEGDFNTARLASDSIAGVVLGTAGGLITSHLVKKGQVKSGFEAIQCTVGGQRVADWGDEFTVGIR